MTHPEMPRAPTPPLSTDAVRAAFLLSLWGWAAWLTKIVFTLLAIGLILITIIVNMGGSSEGLKKSAEDIISQSTGYRAQIETFKGVTFFPRISFAFEGLALSPPNITLADPVMTVDKLAVSSSFWDVFWGTGRVQYIDIRDAAILPGILLPRAVKIDSLSIIDATETSAFLTLQGTLGEDHFLARIGMEATGSGKGRRYFFPEQRAALIEIEGLKLSGSIENSPQGIKFKDIVLSDGPDILKGQFEFIRGAAKTIDALGTLTMAEHQTTLDLDLDLSLSEDQPFIAGTIKSDAFHLEDFAKDSRYSRMINKISAIFADPQVTESVKDIAYTDPSIRLFLQSVMEGGQSLGRYEGLLPLKGQALDKQALRKAIQK